MCSSHAIFLDRDGTIVKDTGGILYKKNIEFLFGLKEFLLNALKLKYKIIMITNQTSVSKGLISYTKMKETNNYLLRKIDKIVGVNSVFDGIYICPYHPNAQVKKYKADPEDRKPKPGMLIKAQKDMQLNFKKCLMVGDRVSDIVAGNLVGCETVLLDGNFNNHKMIKTNLNFSSEMIRPNHNVKSLKDIIPIMEKFL